VLWACKASTLPFELFPESSNTVLRVKCYISGKECLKITVPLPFRDDQVLPDSEHKAPHLSF
jgi:hypothetical protein